MNDYTIDLHSHRFAAWAAGRAASTPPGRDGGDRSFKVKRSVAWLEEAGFDESLGLENLPTPRLVDSKHRNWRNKLKDIAEADNFNLSHGQAAKLINVYLKARFVCGGQQEHPSVRALHPPIDRELLKGLVRDNFGGNALVWREAKELGWSNYNSDEYEALIRELRGSLGNYPFWSIARYWQGYQ